MEPDGAAGHAKIFQSAWNMCASLSRMGTYRVLKHTAAQMLISSCCALFCSQTHQNTLFQHKCTKWCAPVENAASQLPAALNLGMCRGQSQRSGRAAHHASTGCMVRRASRREFGRRRRCSVGTRNTKFLNVSGVGSRERALFCETPLEYLKLNFTPTGLRVKH